MDDIYKKTRPEADLQAVANYDFSELALPILVACSTEREMQNFVRDKGLMYCEVRRLKTLENLTSYPANKILLLLPGWDLDAETKKAVHHWVFTEDRYTVDLTGSESSQGAWSAILAAVVFWVFLLIVL